jgi:hypothetical protein
MVTRVAGMLRAPHPVQGAVLARAEQAAALAAQELVDQVEAVQGEAVHRLTLPGRSHRCAQSSFAKALKFVGNETSPVPCELLFLIRYSLTVYRAETVRNSHRTCRGRHAAKKGRPLNFLERDRLDFQVEFGNDQQPLNQTISAKNAGISTSYSQGQE